MNQISIDEANELVLRRIGEAGDEMILGFLPLSEEEVKAVLGIVRKHLDRSSVTINGLMKNKPAAVAYALAVAPSRSLIFGGDFWPSLKNELGLNIDANARSDLSQSFLRTCKRLGLLAGRIGNFAWVHVDPFIFQAGMLPYWNETLARGVKTTLKKIPAPDLESDETLCRFLDELSHHIYNQSALKKILKTPVGTLLVRRLLIAYQRNDYTVLPAHLQQPMRDAFQQAGRGIVLRAPYLTYDLAFDQIELVLPAQSKRVSTPITCWQVSDRRYSARSESHLSLEDLPERAPRVKLQNLAGSFEEQDFNVDTRVDRNVPFRIFREDSLRELRRHAGSSCSIPPANYLVVMAPEVEAREDECDVYDFPGYRVLRNVELRPGDEPVELKLRERSWKIGCALTAGVFVDHERAQTIRLDDGKLLHYGPDLGLVTYFPQIEKDDLEVFVKVIVGERILMWDLTLDNAKEKGDALVFSEGINPLMTEMANELPPGIHLVQINLSNRTQRVEETFVYWKGLRKVDELHGFQFDRTPENIDFRKSKGITRGNGNTIRFDEQYHAPSITLAISHPSELLIMPRAGIQAVLVTPGEDWEEEPNTDEPIIISRKERRTLRFQSGGFQEWEILCGSQSIAKLTRQRTRFAVSLAGLCRQFGGSGEVSAKGQDGQHISLMSFSMPLTAWSPTFQQDHGLGIGKWILTVPSQELLEIGVHQTDLSERPDAPQVPIIPFTSAVYQFSKELFELVPGVSLSSRKIYRNGTNFVEVCLEFQEDSVKEKFLLVDFYRKAKEESAWIPLQCAENEGYSSVRIVVLGNMRTGFPCSWLRRQRFARNQLNEIGEDGGLAAELDPLAPAELEKALIACRNLLSWKYPLEVWNRVAYHFQELPVHLGRSLFNDNHGMVAKWWEQGVFELTEYSAANQAPVVRRFLFGSQPACLRTPREELESLSGRHFSSVVGRSLSLTLRIQENGGLLPFVEKTYHEGIVSQEAFNSFSNFNDVINSRTENFGMMDLKVFLEAIFSQTEDLDEKCPRPDLGSLLSADHLLTAVRGLNRRCRPVEKVTFTDDAHALVSIAQKLEKAYQQLPMKGRPIAELFCIEQGFVDQYEEGHFVSWWSPPCLESRTSQKVADLIWGVAAISRLAANGRISASQFDEWIWGMFNASNDNVIVDRICILLSLGPELFAFYVALFDLALFENPSI